MHRKVHPTHRVIGLFRFFGIDIEQLWKEAPYGESEHVFLEAKDTAREKYREMAFENHPDRGGDESVFKSATEMWSVLSKLVMKFPKKGDSLSVSPVRGPAHTTIFVGVTKSDGHGNVSADPVEFLEI